MSSLSDLLSWAIGRGGPTKADVPPLQGQPYPGPDEIAAARASDASYGSLAGAFVQPNASGQVTSLHSNPEIETAFNYYEDTGGRKLAPDPVTPNVSDNLMAGYLASNRSALAALGYDPRHMTIGDSPDKANWSVSGSYYPKGDQILTTGVYPSTTTHESMHRGIEALRQAGALPPEADKMSEEAIVRGQMLRNYGDVEAGRGKLGDEQIADGRFYNENSNFAPTMDAIETAAQKLYAARHPRGPR